MGLNDTPSGERVHIGFFGRRNAGKSSVVNRVTGQDLSVVSDTKGTTTDPVYKAMELLPIGPVMIIDTPGFDDEGTLGELRVKKTKQILNKTDIAVLVLDATEGLRECDRELIDLFTKKELPYFLVWNKIDQCEEEKVLDACPEGLKKNSIAVSALENKKIYELKELIASTARTGIGEQPLVGDLLKPSDFIVLVVPIDSAAPKGRLILPQQQVIRGILDAGATAICVKEDELANTLKGLVKKPNLVITDSQAFEEVAKIVPEDIPLTSFSILMARYKGLLATAVEGVCVIDSLKDGDKVLIAEGCTHHRQCDDIGSVKLPRWLKNYTKKELEICLCSGREFPEDLSPYACVIHCGGCMLGEREVRYRMKCAKDQGVAITNYGIAIAFMKGILKRSVAMLPDIGL